VPGPRREEHRLTSTGGFNRRGGQRGTQDSPISVDRRKFLAGVAVAGAATAVTPQKTPIAAPTPHRRPSGLRPSAQLAAAETATPKELPRAHAADGSDFMVDVIKTLDFEYLPANPASSFRGLHGAAGPKLAPEPLPLYALSSFAHDEPRDAALSRGSPFRRRSRGSLRLSAVDPEGPRPENHPATQPVSGRSGGLNRSGHGTARL
jgi:hypothetical protein